MISIGSIIGGPECHFFDEQLTKFMIYCEDNENLGSDSAIVNLVYHLPGLILQPEFVGLRPGKFSKKEKTIMIQVSVEQEFINERDAKKILEYIYETADEGMGIANGKFKQAGIIYDILHDRRFLDTWKELYI